MTGVDGRTVIALPHDRLREVLRKYNRLVGPGDPGDAAAAGAGTVRRGGRPVAGGPGRHLGRAPSGRPAGAPPPPPPARRSGGVLPPFRRPSGADGAPCLRSAGIRPAGRADGAGVDADADRGLPVRAGAAAVPPVPTPHRPGRSAGATGPTACPPDGASCRRAAGVVPAAEASDGREQGPRARPGGEKCQG
jgi:hypothetical protein